MEAERIVNNHHLAPATEDQNDPEEKTSDELLMWTEKVPGEEYPGSSGSENIFHRRN